MTENYGKHKIYLAFGAGRERTFGYVFSTNQGPPAPPHSSAHTMKMHGNLLIFNDSWAAKAAHPTAETVQMHGSRLIFNESGAARAPPIEIFVFLMIPRPPGRPPHRDANA